MCYGGKHHGNRHPEICSVSCHSSAIMAQHKGEPRQDYRKSTVEWVRNMSTAARVPNLEHDLNIKIRHQPDTVCTVLHTDKAATEFHSDIQRSPTAGGFHFPRVKFLPSHHHHRTSPSLTHHVLYVDCHTFATFAQRGVGYPSGTCVGR